MIGGIGAIPIPWDGTTRKHAVESFLSFLNDEDEVRAVDPFSVPRPGWRCVRAWYQGQYNWTVFRPDWIASFIIEGSGPE